MKQREHEPVKTNVENKNCNFDNYHRFLYACEYYKKYATYLSSSLSVKYCTCNYKCDVNMVHFLSDNLMHAVATVTRPPPSL